MATLQKIRNQAGLLVAIIIGMALVAFILGDMLRSGSSLLRGKQMEIAEIAGNTINYQEYQAKVEELSGIYKMNTGSSSVDQKVTDQLREQTWQNMVRTFVMEDVYDELGIKVSSDELFDMIQGQNIHPIVQNLFRDPNTGQVNRGAIIQFLKQLEADGNSSQRTYWIYMEKQIAAERTFKKYNNLISKGLYVTTDEATLDLKGRNKQASIQYVTKPFLSVPDSVISISESELKDYYNEHKEDYKQDEMRRIDYISFPVVASADDDKDAEHWVGDLVADFKSTADDVAFVNMNSDAAYDASFFKKDELSPEVGEFAFSGTAGDIYGPYKESGSWKLAKIRQFENLPDSVEARHILLRVNNANEVAAVQTLADSLKTLIEKGANFAKLATEYSADQGSASNGGNLGWFRRGMMVKPFEEAAFFNKVKSVNLVNTQFGIHIVQTLRKGKKAKNVQLAVVERKIEASSRTYQNVYSKASKFAGENQDKEAFDAAVTELGLSKKLANVRRADKEIRGIENSRLFIRAAFNNTEVGDLVVSTEGTPIFELGDQFVIGVLANEQNEGISSFNSVKSRVELAVKKEKKADYLTAQMSEKDLPALAGKLGVEMKEAQNINFESYSIPGAGIEPAVVGTVASMNADDVSAPVKGNNGVYVVKVVAVTEGPDADVAANKTRLATALAYRANYQAFEALREDAGIVDNRSKFY